jgi:hypothetical protein
VRSFSHRFFFDPLTERFVGSRDLRVHVLFPHLFGTFWRTDGRFKADFHKMGLFAANGTGGGFLDFDEQIFGSMQAVHLQ